MRKTLLLALATLAACSSAAFASDAAEFAKIPVQHNGRVKPFDSFARQTLRLVAGSEKWQKKSATEAVVWLISEPGRAAKEAWVRIDYFELKNHLSLPKERTHFSP